MLLTNTIGIFQNLPIELVELYLSFFLFDYRTWRDYIATVPSEDMDAMERAAGRLFSTFHFTLRVRIVSCLDAMERPASKLCSTFHFPFKE